MRVQAQSQGEPSKKHPQGDVNDEIQGFSQLAFVQKDGVHVAIVTSLTQNKVGMMQMGGFPRKGYPSLEIGLRLLVLLLDQSFRISSCRLGSCLLLQPYGMRQTKELPGAINTHTTGLCAVSRCS